MAPVNCQHVWQLDIQDVVQLLHPSDVFGEALSKAYRGLVNAKKAPLYRACYQYGMPVVGPRSKSDLFNKLISPCGNVARPCDGCKSLTIDTDDHRPLIMVLTGSAEEHLQFPQTERLGRDERVRSRNIPLRIVQKGENIGANEILNAFHFSDYGKRGNKIFGTPARKLTAGARSVYLNASLTRLAGALRSRVQAKLLSRYYRINRISTTELGAELDHDHGKLVKMLSEAAGSQWYCELLVIPFRALRELIWNGNCVRRGSEELLLKLYEAAWSQSRHSRSVQLRQAAVADPLARKGTNIYLEQTVNHLLALARGEFPGFAPFQDRDEAGPLREILEFLNRSRLSDAFDCFPSVLQPAHLGKGTGCRRAVYYSFAYPSLLSPVRKQHSGPDLMQELRIRLNDIQRQGRTTVKQATWHFYRSSGLPKPGRHFDVFADTTEAAADFQDQLNLAEGLNILGRVPFFGPQRNGFLSKFVRLFLEADTL